MLSVGWLLFALLMFGAVRRVRILSDVLGDPDRAAIPTPAPPLTVVVTARDEEAGIETTVGRLLDQKYGGLQVVVVDDRSRDATGAILDRIARSPAARGRLEVVHNTTLPDGWLGKCHACRLGASRAKGDWILFTDGDVALVEDDLLARTVVWAERERIDHLAAIPDMGRMSMMQSAMIAAFGQAFLVVARCWEMDRDLPRGGAGIGAFNLVRRSAYEKIGGHETLKMDPTDDVKLGQLLKASGARQRIVNGYGLVLCPWHVGTSNAVRGLEKNGFAGLGYSLTVLIGFTVVALSLGWGPLILALAGVFFVGPKAGGLAAATACAPLILQEALLVLGWAAASRPLGAPFGSVLFYPAGVAALVVAMWNSAIKTLSRGGIEWRGTFYPLAALRRGLVRPGRGRDAPGLQSGGTG